MTLAQTALAHYDAQKLAATLERALARIRELEQELKWRDQLDAVPATVMSPSHKATLRAAVKAYQQGMPDANGLVQIESWKLCKTVGQSRQTFLDNLTYCSEQLGILTKKRECVVDSNTHDYTTNLSIGVTPLLAHPHQYKVETPRNHGGERQLCPHCQSDRLQRKVTITCMDCGTILDETCHPVNQGNHLEDSPQRQDDQAEPPDMHTDQEATSGTNVNLTTNITKSVDGQVDDSNEMQEPTTPPAVGDAPGCQQAREGQAAARSCPDENQRNAASQADILARAAALLVEIAGPEPVHIEMSPRGPDKYYPVRRTLSVQDARVHLKGWKTKGASLRYPDDMTRALCYDADHAETWEHLLDAARFLSEAGYCVIVEDSPAGRGGHLWIIYTGLVNATWAHRHAQEVAPMLQHIHESWPGTHHNKVRLPGGKYVKPGFAAWCKLYDAHGARVAEDGQEAARVLLDYQTPAAIVPAYPEPDKQGSDPAENPDIDHQGQRGNKPSTGQAEPWVDARWQQKYGRYLWFQFTPAQLAAWYNERNQVHDLLPPEQNGMGLASWRGERTASVSLRETGWVDFGASARRSDGKPDGGDALELTARICEEPKPDVMRQIARQLVSEAREAMESAARNGKQPPQWVQTFMSPAGWQHYHLLREEAGYSDQSITNTQELTAHTGGVAGSCSNSPAQAAPYSLLTQETLAAFAAEIGATIGEPCKTCDCALYRRMAEYQVCVRCYPPREYHRFAERIDKLYPRRNLPAFGN